MRSSDSSNKSSKRWSRHSCLLTYIKPNPHYPVSGHATTRRRLPHWKKDGAIYWITFRLADAIPRDKRRAVQEGRKLWLKPTPNCGLTPSGKNTTDVSMKRSNPGSMPAWGAL